MEHTIIIISFFLIYFHISGLATTNILRLTSGNTLTIMSSKCKCDNCGKKISAFYQLPIVSYIICKGECKNCGTKIPVYPLIMEIAVFIGMFLITVLFEFSVKGVVFSFLYYEVVRITTIQLRGRRNSQFVKQYIIAVLLMLPFCLLACFVALLYSEV